MAFGGIIGSRLGGEDIGAQQHFNAMVNGDGGLRWDDMKNIYTRYGTTTKDESDDYTGMFGVGSKAAMTYTNQFTGRSVKNGEPGRAPRRIGQGIRASRRKRPRHRQPVGLP